MKQVLSTWLGMAFMVVCIVSFVWHLLGAKIASIADGVASLMGG